jgi:signal transduction histidine kinase
MIYLMGLATFALTAMGIEMAFVDWNFYGAQAATDAVFFPPFGSVATAAYVYFLGQVIQRNRLLDRLEIISRLVVFAVMAMVLGAVYGVLVRLIGHPTGPFAEAVDILIASILVLILYEPVKIATEAQVSRYFARERFEYIRAIEEMKRRLRGLIEVGPVIETLFDGSLFTGRQDLSSLYLYDEVRDGYRLRRWEGDPEKPLSPAFAQRPFIDGWLAGSDHYLLDDLAADEVRQGSSAPDWLEPVQGTMRSMQAELSLPLRIGNTVIGVWNFRIRPGAPNFSEQELVLLRDLAGQLAVQIDNSKSFERMKERDRLATLGEMSAGLAHEIRNPLGAIKGATQILSKDNEFRSGRSQEFLGIIVEEVDRLDGVVGQFLDYARPMNMRVEPVDPDLLVRGVLSMVEAEGLPEGIRVDYSPGDGIPPVLMDVEKLKQVVINIVRNGIEAMAGSGGVLSIGTRLRGRGSEHFPSLRMRSPRAGEVRTKRGHIASATWVELLIEDAGVGICADDISKLFIPFFTTKAQGTGLGLPICERILREHRGEIEIESVPDQGSRFILRLPVEGVESTDPPSLS